MGRGDKWTAEQVASLLHQITASGCKPQAVNVLGRSSRAIDHKISQLRQAKQLKIRFVTPWSLEEDGLLLLQIGVELKTTDQIRVPGRTFQAVYSRIKELRSPVFKITPVRRLRPQQVVALARRQKVEERKARLRQLRSLVYGIARYWPSDIVMEQLGCKADWVTRWRKRWGLEFELEEAKKDPVFVKRHNESIAKRLKAKCEKKRRVLVESKEKSYNNKLLRGKLEELFRKMSQQGASYRLRCCSICGCGWYLCKTFFHLLPGSPDKLSKVCVACSDSGPVGAFPRVATPMPNCAQRT